MISFFYQYELLMIRVSLSFHFGNFSETKSKLSIMSSLFRYHKVSLVSSTHTPPTSYRPIYE